MMIKKITQKQRRRFEIIETVAYWEGIINATILVKLFGVSWSNALKEFNAYKEHCPEQFEYNASLKLFIVKDGFKPRYISTDWDVYHAHIITFRTIYNAELWNSSAIEILPLTYNSVNNDVIRKVSIAIKNGDSLTVKYCSLKHPRGLTRTLHPHAIAFNGIRWHLRAFSKEHGEFRDFNLSRIKKIVIKGKSDINLLDDHDWHSIMSLDLSAHPKLDTKQRKLVLSDYGYSEDFSVNLRASMIKYFVKMHSIATDTQQDPFSHPLFLKNAESLDNYIL
ncbi:MAG: WYL domain-containing protein [Methylophaga sp.]|nr:WYL domain-containing protein [Methylophaga sp.]